MHVMQDGAGLPLQKLRNQVEPPHHERTVTPTERQQRSRLCFTSETVLCMLKG